MKASIYVACAVGILLQCTQAVAQPASAPIALSMPEQPLRDALNGLARQTGLQVIYTAEEVTAGLLAPKIEGKFTPEAALSLLLKNSGLHYQFINPRTVAVTQAGAKVSTSSSFQETASPGLQLRSVEGSEAVPAQGSHFTLVQAGSRSERTRLAAADQAGTPPAATPKQEDDTMVVTGSHIRGGTSNASPMMSFNRADILRSGAGSTHQFIQTLPQNWAGGYSETTIGSILGGEGANLNYGFASGPNLRGLGNDSTLTLLNGRRLAPTSVGEAVDVSMIPITAIERIDVLTDGASAIYGSDAVAGVVNIVLRKNYSGAETSLRYGDVTNGSNSELKAGQTLGHDWGTGNVFVGYEYLDRKQLSVDERSYTSGALFSGAELIPPLRQDTGLFSLSQELGAKMRLYGSALYSKRDTVSTYFSGANIRSPSESEQLSSSLSLVMDIGSTWQADVGASHSRNETRSTTFQNNVLAATVAMQSTTQSFDAKADGAVFSMPGGSAKLAVGGQYRRDAFNSSGAQGGNTGGELSRNVTALSSELLLPLVGQANGHPGMQRFEISLAARYEDYSDVGSTTDPKVGILWAPSRALSLRGTYGTSFRAPSFYESNTIGSPIRPIVYRLPDPLNPAPQGSYLIVLYGNTGDLKPEESTNWTLGFDYKPEAIKGFGVSMTYFNIDFTNRVAEPLAVSSAFTNVLIQEAQHPEIVMRNPPLALVQSYLSSPRLLSTVGPVTAGQISAIVSNLRTNVAGTVESGIDFNLSYDMETAVGVIGLESNASYLLEKQTRMTPGSQVLDSMNGIFLPVDLRIRNSVNWSRGNLGATLFVSYVDGYRDVRPGVNNRVSSWTTADVTGRYAFGETAGWMKGTTVSLAINNVLDEDPPFINYFGFNFDATNANALNRYVSLTVVKEW